MSGITDWRAALIDPRFWACYYTVEDEIREEAFGTSYDVLEPYYLQMIGASEMHGTEPSPAVPGSMLHIPLPEAFEWQIAIRISGDYHTLYHPEHMPDGLLVAEISNSPSLPSLRWEELTQIVECATTQWMADFQPWALLPLLFPVVGLTRADANDQVRRRLRIVWSDMDVLRPQKLDFWLDVLTAFEDDMTWTLDAQHGYVSNVPESPRHESSAQFAPFFAMVARQVRNLP